MRAVRLIQREITCDLQYRPTIERGAEVPVRILAAGICETDLQLAQGYMGFQGVLGHEFVGIAESGSFQGERVVGEINCACQDCPTCESGNPRHCPNRTVLGILQRDGAFADRVWLPESNLHPLPFRIPTWMAVFVEPLAAAFRILEQAPHLAGLPTVVLGDGRLGNLCAQVLSNAGNQVTVVGKHPSKLQKLTRLGIATALKDDWETVSVVPLVIDCTGSADGLSMAQQLVAPCGTIVLKTTIAAPHHTQLAPLVINEVSLLGSRCGPFPPAIAALSRGEIELADLVERIIPLEEVPAAIHQSMKEPLLKVLIDVAGDGLTLE